MVQRLGHLQYTSKSSVMPKQLCDEILTNESFVEVDSPRLVGHDRIVEQLIDALEKVKVNGKSTE